jgi:5,5'-dehydrodivanillate O-demethylase
MGQKSPIGKDSPRREIFEPVAAAQQATIGSRGIREGVFAMLNFAELEPVGPGTPAGRYLRRFWHPVSRASDLRRGQAKPLEILGERFTLYRGEDGVARVVGFRCAHRGTQLSTGWVEGTALRCRYHGWKYDAAGQCVEQPNEPRPFCEKARIPTYPTREYASLVFAYLGEGAPPPFRTYPDLDRPGTLVADPPERLPCSFWNRLDNDLLHIPWVHRATAQRRGWNHYFTLYGIRAEEAPFGMKTLRFAPEGESQTALGLRQFHYFFMPTTQLFWQRTRAKGYEGRELWDAKHVWTVPVNDRAYVNFDVTNTPLFGEEGKAYAEARLTHEEAEAETRWQIAERVLAGEMTLEDLPADMTATTSFEIEDYVTQVGQGTVAARGDELLGPTDIQLALIRRLWLREVSALVEERPLTSWQIPAEPLAVLAGAV